MALQIVKQVKNATKYDNGCIRLDNVRLSYPHIAVPQTDDKGKKSFSAVFLLNKETHAEAIQLLRDEVAEVKAKNPGKAVAKDKLFIRDGDGDAYSEKPECHGHYVVAAREKTRPTVRDNKNKPVDVEDIENVLYAGCYVDGLIMSWFQDNEFGKRINANLKSLRFHADGEAFGQSRVDDAEVWGAEEEEAGWGDDEDDI